LLSIGSELASDDGDRLTRALQNAGQDTANIAGQRIIDRNLNVQPTLKVRGTFKPTATGFEGTIATLMTNKKVRFVANEKKKTENSPDYFVKSGRCDLGVAWNDVTEPDDDTAPLEYISVKLDGPEMTKPINAALFHRDDGADLVWSRPKSQ